MKTKICKGVCGLEKSLDSFSDGRNYCKICYSFSKKEWDNRYYIKNRNDLLQYQKEYQEDRKEEKSEYDKNRYQENKEEKLIYQRNYQKENKNELSKKKNIRDKNRRKNDPSFRLRKNVSKRISEILKSNNSSKKGKSILEYIPYSFDKLKKHIQSLFEPWMTWENQGIYKKKEWDDEDQSTWKWQLDHIIPQSDLTYKSMADENFKKCWDLSNLRPLSAKQNMLDGASRVRHQKKETK